MAEDIKGKFQQHAPSEDNNQPLPSEFQLNQKAIINFGRGQTVHAVISGVLFYDPALYYEMRIRVVNSPEDERYVIIEVPAGIVEAFPEE